jgi:hypothetical protein
VVGRVLMAGMSLSAVFTRGWGWIS